MILDWYMAGPDAAANYENLNFRVHKTTIEKKYTNYQDKGTFGVYQLQVREKGKIHFKDLGYNFFTNNCPINAKYYAMTHSIDEELWDSITDIVDRVEEILVSLDFIPSEKVLPLEAKNLQLLQGASRAFIAALKKHDFLRNDIDDIHSPFLEDMFLRGIQHYITFDKEHLFDSSKNISPIRQAEFEIDLTYAMAEPTMYFIGGWPEGFWDQHFLHDDEWLQEHLNNTLTFEDEIHKKPSTNSLNSISMYISNKFRIIDEEKFMEVINDINEINQSDILYTYDNVIFRKYDDCTYRLFCKSGSHLYHIFEEDKGFLKKFQSIIPDDEVIVFKDISANLLSDITTDEDYEIGTYLTFITSDSIKDYSVDKVIVKDVKSILRKMKNSKTKSDTESNNKS
ncbi:hypothetical protein MZM54_03660 [[Brevibacterium] frigoritolerans]|nr:hypothetical protein [Peribacillus frigoritolerans]